MFAQFDVSDNRTLDQVVNWLMGMGYIPSFCTACYGKGAQATVSCPCARADRFKTAAIPMPL